MLDRSVKQLYIGSKYIESATGFHSILNSYPPWDWEDKSSRYTGIWYDHNTRQIYRSYYLIDSTNKYFGGTGVLIYNIKTGKIMETCFPFIVSRFVKPQVDMKDVLFVFNYYETKKMGYSAVMESYSLTQATDEQYKDYLNKVEQINHNQLSSNSISPMLPDYLKNLDYLNVLVINLDRGCEECLLQLKDNLITRKIS